MRILALIPILALAACEARVIDSVTYGEPRIDWHSCIITAIPVTTVVPDLDGNLQYRTDTQIIRGRQMVKVRKVTEHYHLEKKPDQKGKHSYMETISIESNCA